VVLNKQKGWVPFQGSGLFVLVGMDAGINPQAPPNKTPVYNQHHSLSFT